MSKEKQYLTLSVHDLVDFLLRKGDIDNRVYNQETMMVGTKIHAAFQKKQGNEYLSEVVLKETFDRPLGVINLEGRADGIIIGGPFPIVDEIKSSVLPLDVFYEQQEEWHKAQAMCYALMYAHENGCEKMGIRLTYISQIDSGKKTHEAVYSTKEIEEYICGLMDRYLAFWDSEFNHLKERNEKAKDLAFPFEKFRSGQRNMAKYVYSVASNGGTFLVEAPTGIGKTMSALFPSIKSFATGKTEKIFYLTAKNSGSMSAYDALTKLYEKGLCARDSLITSKEKICFKPGASCNPDDCPYAKGYYDKIRSVTEKAIKSGRRFSPDYIVELAEEEQICPFEMELDLSLWSDIIVCDYNYFFDPLVKLERYFGEDADPSKHVLLIDEAHNLVERGRDMYGAYVSLVELKDAKKAIGTKTNKTLRLALNKIQKVLKTLMENLEEERKIFDEVPASLISALESLGTKQRSLDKEKHLPYPATYREFSRECHAFASIYQGYSEHLTCYAEKKGDDFVFRVYCPDPAPLLSESLKKVKGHVLFSATLSPIEYYMNAIEGEEGKPYLLLPSPFPPKNFKIIVAPSVSTRYKDRVKSYDEVAKYLETFVSGKKGNYFIFFPSYEYLENIKEKLQFENAHVYVQERNMTNDEKQEFLEHFRKNPKKTHIGLLIMGGSFSEGIDMVDDRLIGVAIVGIGLPQLSYERDLIRDYYDSKNGNGFDYSYKNPGLNKVMQAMGRLIRSENDRGVALLIDDRYLQNEYRMVLERSYSGYEVAFSPEEVKESLDSFFPKGKK